MNTEIRSTLVEFIVANYLFGDASRVPGDDGSLVESGVIDSTGVLELIEFLETRFNISVTESETVPSNLDTVHNLIRFVVTKQAAAGAAA